MRAAAHSEPAAEDTFRGGFIGPEGGFEPGEVALARHAGAACATLGPRILRTETAPIAALAAIMQATGNL
ncbi:MAG: RsmE family RNA methyltransferase [Hydrogeniiclostridium mannosilyticum]